MYATPGVWPREVARSDEEDEGTKQVKVIFARERGSGTWWRKRRNEAGERSDAIFRGVKGWNERLNVRGSTEEVPLSRSPTTFGVKWGDRANMWSEDEIWYVNERWTHRKSFIPMKKVKKDDLKKLGEWIERESFLFVALGEIVMQDQSQRGRQKIKNWSYNYTSQRAHLGRPSARQQVPPWLADVWQTWLHARQILLDSVSLFRTVMIIFVGRRTVYPLQRGKSLGALLLLLL